MHLVRTNSMSYQEQMAYLAQLYFQMGDYEAAEICRVEAEAAAPPKKRVCGCCGQKLKLLQAA